MEKMEKKWKMENNGENSGPLTSLPVDRLERRRSCQLVKLDRAYPVS